MPEQSTEPSSSSPLAEAISAPPPDVDTSVLHRAIAASALGNMTEWFDYGVYAATLTYLTHAFFPGSLGSIGTYLGFAISFALRPLGGMVWGPLGDRVGRKVVMATTILLMAGSTALIGALPTHAQVGALAPVLLILLRVVQGFSTGGEYGGAATFMAEYSPDRKRGRYGSFLEFGTMCGFVLGSAVVLLLQHLLSDTQMQSFGWRIPFYLALPLGLVGWYLRSRMSDTPVFSEMQGEPVAKQTAGQRFVELLRNYWPPILIMFGMVIALNVVNYTLLTYMPTYLQGTIGLSDSSATLLVVIGELVMALFIPVFGRLSDVTGRKPMWWGSLIGLLVFAWPLFLLMSHGFGWAVVSFVILGLLYIPQLATISATFPAMFPTPVRYAGFAISYNVATAAFGGTAGLVNDAVVRHSGWNLFPAWYMMGACVIGLIAMPFLKETKGCSIRGTEVPGPDTAATRIAQLAHAG
ncbi:MFS transporter [Tsukamurella soli]|uniref:MFS transporter n=1 Tax=Tsukamurella soli TaxID=644556 RepID=A0ABP8JTC0_9ACTN